MSFSFVPLLTAQQHYTAVLYNVKSIILHYFYISIKFEVLLCVIGFLLSYSEDIPPHYHHHQYHRYAWFNNGIEFLDFIFLLFISCNTVIKISMFSSLCAVQSFFSRFPILSGERKNSTHSASFSHIMHCSTILYIILNKQFIMNYLSSTASPPIGPLISPFSIKIH